MTSSRGPTARTRRPPVRESPGRDPCHEVDSDGPSHGFRRTREGLINGADPPGRLALGAYQDPLGPERPRGHWVPVVTGQEGEITVDGGILRFRGSADKVDERRDGTLLVTDIKSGSIRTFKDLSETNPVARGEKLQLPVYAHAAHTRHGTDTTAVEAMYWFVRKDRGKRPQVPLNDRVKELYAGPVGLLVRCRAKGGVQERAQARAVVRQGRVQCP